MIKIRRAPEPGAQRDAYLVSLHTAIDRICDGWEGAVEAVESRGYGQGRVYGDAQSTTVSRPSKPVYDSFGQFVGMERGSGEVRDVVGDEAIRFNLATKWLDDARSLLALLLAISPADEPGERRWTGPFYPPRLRRTLHRAVVDAVELWPKNISHFFDKIAGLGNEAAIEFPLSPKVGERIDGVVVGERALPVETCAECGKPVAGGAADPLRRINDKPFHQRPCYETARKRRQRAGVPLATTLSHPA